MKQDKEKIKIFMTNGTEKEIREWFKEEIEKAKQEGKNEVIKKSLEYLEKNNLICKGKDKKNCEYCEGYRKLLKQLRGENDILPYPKG